MTHHVARNLLAPPKSRHQPGKSGQFELGDGGQFELGTTHSLDGLSFPIRTGDLVCV